jgi:putative adhesin
MDNGAQLDTEEGDIEVRNASGKIETDAARGKQQFSEIVGDLQARGQYGAMELDTVRGLRLEAMLHEGSVIGRRISSRNVTVWISRGNIRIDGTAGLGASWRLMTYQGDVEVRLARAMPMILRARARSGQVHLPPQLRVAQRDDDGWTVASSQQRAAQAQALLELASTIGNIAVSF